MLYSVIKPEAKRPQLTIFYAGEVIVFDDCSAEKAKEIMSFASKGISQSQNNNYAYTFTHTHLPFPFNVNNIIPDTSKNLVQDHHPQAPSRPVVCGNFFTSLTFEKMEDFATVYAFSDS